MVLNCHFRIHHIVTREQIDRNYVPIFLGLDPNYHTKTMMNQIALMDNNLRNVALFLARPNPHTYRARGRSLVKSSSSC